MRFDSSARAQHLLRKTWNADPRLLRFSVVKMGTKFENTCDIGGQAEEWADVPGNMGTTEPPGALRKEKQAQEAMGGMFDDILNPDGLASKLTDQATYTYK